MVSQIDSNYGQGYTAPADSTPVWADETVFDLELGTQVDDNETALGNDTFAIAQSYLDTDGLNVQKIVRAILDDGVFKLSQTELLNIENMVAEAIKKSSNSDFEPPVFKLVGHEENPDDEPFLEEGVDGAFLKTDDKNMILLSRELLDDPERLGEVALEELGESLTVHLQEDGILEDYGVQVAEGDVGARISSTIQQEVIEGGNWVANEEEDFTIVTIGDNEFTALAATEEPSNSDRPHWDDQDYLRFVDDEHAAQPLFTLAAINNGAFADKQDLIAFGNETQFFDVAHYEATNEIIIIPENMRTTDVAAAVVYYMDPEVISGGDAQLDTAAHVFDWSAEERGYLGSWSDPQGDDVEGMNVQSIMANSGGLSISDSGHISIGGPPDNYEPNVPVTEQAGYDNEGAKAFLQRMLQTPIGEPELDALAADGYIDFNALNGGENLIVVNTGAFSNWTNDLRRTVGTAIQNGIDSGDPNEVPRILEERLGMTGNAIANLETALGEVGYELDSMSVAGLPEALDAIEESFLVTDSLGIDIITGSNSDRPHWDDQDYLRFVDDEHAAQPLFTLAAINNGAFADKQDLIAFGNETQFFDVAHYEATNEIIIIPENMRTTDVAAAVVYYMDPEVISGGDAQLDTAAHVFDWSAEERGYLGSWSDPQGDDVEGMNVQSIMANSGGLSISDSGHISIGGPPDNYEPNVPVTEQAGYDNEGAKAFLQRMLQTPIGEPELDALAADGYIDFNALNGGENLIVVNTGAFSNWTNDLRRTVGTAIQNGIDSGDPNEVPRILEERLGMTANAIANLETALGEAGYELDSMSKNGLPEALDVIEDKFFVKDGLGIGMITD